MHSFLSFFRALFSLRHIPTLIILALNFYVLVILVLNVTHDGRSEYLYSVSAGLTLAALAIIVSPIGDWWVLQSIKSQVVRADKSDIAGRLEPIFNTVLNEARQEEPDISENVQLYIVEEAGVNAYAAGRRIVCLTRGAVQACDDEMLRALLSHEFGHMAHRDSEVTLLICVGLVPLINGQKVMRNIMFFLAAALPIFCRNPFAALFISLSCKAFYYLCFGIPCLVLQTLINLLRTLGAHAAEYGADAFCVRLGHGQALRHFMEAVSYSEPEGSLIDSIFSSHPASSKRLSHIERLLAKTMDGKEEYKCPLCGFRIKLKNRESVCPHCNHLRRVHEDGSWTDIGTALRCGICHTDLHAHHPEEECPHCRNRFSYTKNKWVQTGYMRKCGHCHNVILHASSSFYCPHCLTYVSYDAKQATWLYDGAYSHLWDWLKAMVILWPIGLFVWMEDERLRQFVCIVAGAASLLTLIFPSLRRQSVFISALATAMLICPLLLTRDNDPVLCAVCSALFFGALVVLGQKVLSTIIALMPKKSFKSPLRK